MNVRRAGVALTYYRNSPFRLDQSTEAALCQTSGSDLRQATYGFIKNSYLAQNSVGINSSQGVFELRRFTITFPALFGFVAGRLRSLFYAATAQRRSPRNCQSAQSSPVLLFALVLCFLFV
jgi:hypothetical protein